MLHSITARFSSRRDDLIERFDSVLLSIPFLLLSVVFSLIAFQSVALGIDSDHSTAHGSLMELVADSKVTTRTVQSGDWSDAETWDLGVPGDGARALVAEGHTVTVDGVMMSKMMSLRVDGNLEFATDVHTQLTVDTMLVGMMGALKIGTESNPVSAAVTAKIVIEDYLEQGIVKELDEDGSQPIDYDPHQIGQGLVAMGRVEMRGAQMLHGCTLAVEPSVGDDAIHLDVQGAGWRVGDVIVIAGTTRDALGDERRIITSLANDNKVIGLDHPLEKNHHTPNHGKAGLALKVHVINLTRNVSVETAEAGRAPFPVEKVGGIHQYNRRGHMMFMHNKNVRLRYTGFYGLGRSNKAQKANDTVVADDGTITSVGTNPKGRYSVHFHQAGRGGGAASVAECALEGSPGWGYVNHSSRVEFYRNVAYNARAASFVTEAGDEVGSFIENISIRNDIDEIQSSGDLRFQKRKNKGFNGEFAFGGHGFWYQGISVISRRNVASGAGREAMTIYPLFLSGRLFDNVTVKDTSITDRPSDSTVLLKKIPLHTFEGEIVYGSNIGLMVGEHRPEGYASLVKDFLGWSVKMGLSTNYSADVSYQDITLIGDLDEPEGLAVYSHHGSSNIEFINPHMEGFALGIQLPRSGNHDANGGSIRANVTYKYGRVENGYFNNLINIHFPLVRAHNPLLVEVITPSFGILSPTAITHALPKLAAIDGDGDFNIDSSNNGGNGFEILKTFVNNETISKPYNYFLHYAAGPEYDGATKHKRNMTLPHRFTLDLGEAGKYQLFLKDVQDPDHIPFPRNLYKNNISSGSAGSNNDNVLEEQIDQTNAELTALYQINSHRYGYYDFFDLGKRNNYPNLAFAMTGSMLPRDFESLARFEQWDDAFNVVAMRIDDLPEYKTYLNSLNGTLALFDFESVDRPLEYRTDKPAAWTAGPTEVELDRFDSGNSRLFLDGAGDAIDYIQPFALGYKTMTWVADVRPLATQSGVIYEWAGQDAAYQIALDDGEVVASLQIGPTQTIELRGGVVEAGKWHQIALTINYGHGQAYFYLDGARLGSAEIPTITGLDQGIARIGNSAGNFLRVGAFRGFIDDLRLLHRSFTNETLAEYYSSEVVPVVDQTDRDTDGDGEIDLLDAFPIDPSEQTDSDGDGIGDNGDPDPNVAFADADGDHVADDLDSFPNDPSEWIDTDLDGQGNNADDDDDGDQISDVDEWTHGLDPLNRFDAQLDSDGDQQSNYYEIFAGTDPTDASSRFRISMIKVTESGVDIEWTGSSEKTYAIEYSEDLEQWNSLPGAEAVTKDEGFTDESSAKQRFYRIIVLP